MGNDEGAAVIECTLMGPELRFDAPALIAVTGAQAAVKLNGQEVPGNQSIAVQAGDTLGFGFMKLGARSYIAVAGGIDVPVVLGSRSTYGLGAFGGFEGRKLLAGDKLPVGTPSAAARPAGPQPSRADSALARNRRCACCPASTSIACRKCRCKTFL